MVKHMEIIAHQGFGEWVWKVVSCLYLLHFHNIVGKIPHNKMVAKSHSFLVQVSAKSIHVQHHTHVYQKYRCSLVYLDLHWSKVVFEHNRLLGIFLQWCELGPKCWVLHRCMVFLWPCWGCWSYYRKQSGDQSPSDLVVPMVLIHKHLNFQFIR